MGKRCNSDRKHHWDTQTKLGLMKIAASAKRKISMEFASLPFW